MTDLAISESCRSHEFARTVVDINLALYGSDFKLKPASSDKSYVKPLNTGALLSKKSRFQQVLEEAQRLKRAHNKQVRELASRIENLKSLIRETQLILDDPELSESDKDEYWEQISHYEETLAKYSKKYRFIGLDSRIDSGYKSPAGGESLPSPTEGGESLPSTGHRPHQISHKVIRKIGWVTKRIEDV